MSKDKPPNDQCTPRGRDGKPRWPGTSRPPDNRSASNPPSGDEPKWE